MPGFPELLQRGYVPPRVAGSYVRAALFVMAATWGLLSVPTVCAQEPSLGYPTAVVPVGQVGWIGIEAAIHPAMVAHVEGAIKWASREGLSCLVMEVDTPGGLDTSMRRIVKAILSSPVPVVVYVSPAGSRAASAGLFLLTAAHVAAMAPGTNLGAAHPVSIGGGMIPGGDRPDTTMITKVTNDAVAYIRSLAEIRGRNVDWVERAVRQSVSAAATEALDLGVIDLVAATREELLRAVDGREVEVAGQHQTLRTAGAAIVERKMSLRDQILGAIADPNIAYLLLLLGGLGIFFELSHPGTLFPGIVGAVCLLLAFFALQMLPVRAAGVALIGLAIILFILEIKVTSYGALSIGGVAALAFGSLMLYDTGATGVRIAWGVLLPSVLIVAGLFIFGTVMAIRAHGRRTVTGKEGLVGEVAEAVSDLAPAGRVFVHGEIWNAVSRVPVKKGQAVRVLVVDRLRLEVEPVVDAALHDRGDDAGS
ncbi:MAG: nodulation protein NfeD [Candidatus Eisenbacteria sp.]|nr:nodulation protein NfeD [Candidatus Eisenbacteria bacterium]